MRIDREVVVFDAADLAFESSWAGVLEKVPWRDQGTFAGAPPAGG
jgi:hypothetical protein